MDIDYAAATLWAGMKEKNHMPADWFGKLTLAQAYAVQLNILKRRVAEGDQHAGWKVGLTSQAMRKQQNVAEPCFAHLMASGHLPSGLHIKYDSLIRPGIENELCLTLGSTLHGPNVSFDQALAAIATVEPALELIEVRGDFSADKALSMADNAQQYGFITGKPVVYDPAVALDKTIVNVNFNHTLVETANGAEVMGNPVYSLMWLAGKLAEFGLSLDAGMKVMSGSFTKQYAVAAGDTVTSHFSDFGSVEATFER
ncbi:fumarylacetoacetate hydrolase family protein [Alcaligenaceae bacterium]|nr:fumarylacetoacetate hydrolase family protein [Alcaligenaceae bacterium]